MWTYAQATGELFDAAAAFVDRGYSGNGAAKNDPDQQCLKGHGPIPRGFYTIQAPVDPPDHLGPLALPLLPDPANKMCKRSEFLIHGDSIENPGTASNGCIILQNSTRNRIHQSGDVRLQVVAQFP